MSKFIQVSTTVNDRRAANRIAHSLLEKRLAACVQILSPADSHYWWKGKIEHEKEWFLLIKSRANYYRRIEAAVKKLHPYKVPEILSVPIQHGNPDYLEWIRYETSRRTGTRAKRKTNIVKNLLIRSSRNRPAH